MTQWPWRRIAIIVGVVGVAAVALTAWLSGRDAEPVAVAPPVVEVKPPAQEEQKEEEPPLPSVTTAPAKAPSWLYAVEPAGGDAEEEAEEENANPSADVAPERAVLGRALAGGEPAAAAAQQIGGVRPVNPPVADAFLEATPLDATTESPTESGASNHAGAFVDADGPPPPVVAPARHVGRSLNADESG